MEKNELVYNNASYLYNKLLNDYEHLDEKKKKSIINTNLKIYFLKETTIINVLNLTSNKLLTTLPILLAQTKAGNYSNKLKNEIRQIVYLLYQHKSPKNVTTESRHYNNVSVH